MVIAGRAPLIPVKAAVPAGRRRALGRDRDPPVSVGCGFKSLIENGFMLVPGLFTLA